MSADDSQDMVMPGQATIEGRDSSTVILDRQMTIRICREPTVGEMRHTAFRRVRGCIQQKINAPVEMKPASHTQTGGRPPSPPVGEDELIAPDHRDDRAVGVDAVDLHLRAADHDVDVDGGLVEPRADPSRGDCSSAPRNEIG